MDEAIFEINGNPIRLKPDDAEKKGEKYGKCPACDVTTRLVRKAKNGLPAYFIHTAEDSARRQNCPFSRTRIAASTRAKARDTAEC
jgi:hypothetical protein